MSFVRCRDRRSAPRAVVRVAAFVRAVGAPRATAALASVLATALVAAAVTPSLAAAGKGSKMMSLGPHQLVRAVEMTYTVLQGGTTIGDETVTRSDYDDNSVEFHSSIGIVFPQGTGMDVETDLVLEEDSFFPLRFEMTKKMSQGGVDYTLGTHYDWFANVAVVRKNTNGSEDTVRVALPAGVAVVDMGVAHLLYVPLYWYDHDVGGSQSFAVVDPMTRKTYSATLRRQVAETIEVGGKTVEADRYEFTRDKQTYTLFVDADGRIVKLDQGFLVYELSGWSERAAGDE